MADAIRNQVCGIVMPISPFDDLHTADHWKEILAIFEEAIAAAGLTPNPVWVGGDTTIIHAKILKNLFENDFVLCDCSTLNPNVMLEFGMRLTTKKPTIPVAEYGTKLPFDTSLINTVFYDPAQKHGNVKTFVDELTKELLSAKASYEAGSYRSFLEHLTFERVEPGTISVQADQAIERRLDELWNGFRRLERVVRNVVAHPVSSSISSSYKTLDLDVAEPVALNLKHDFVVGSKVHHAKFGVGMVVGVDGSKLEVDFVPPAGRKRVLASFVDSSPEEL